MATFDISSIIGIASNILSINQLFPSLCKRGVRGELENWIFLTFLHYFCTISEEAVQKQLPNGCQMATIDISKYLNYF